MEKGVTEDRQLDIMKLNRREFEETQEIVMNEGAHYNSWGHKSQTWPQQQIM